MPRGKPKTRERLNLRQLAFIDNLFRGMTQTAAYCEAYGITETKGKKRDSARVDASRLLTVANIQAELERRRKIIDGRVAATTERIAQELAHIAFADPVGSGFVRLIDGEMYLSDTTVLPESLRRSIAEVQQTKHGVRVRFHKKTEALRMLGQWRKMFVDKLEIDISSRLADRLRRARERRAQQATPPPQQPAAPAEGDQG
jgi:phage terminase small subunit